MVIYQLEIQLHKYNMLKLEVKRNNKIQTVQTSGCFKSIHKPLSQTVFQIFVSKCKEVTTLSFLGHVTSLVT